MMIFNIRLMINQFMEGDKVFKKNMIYITAEKTVQNCLDSFKLGIIQANIVCKDSAGELMEFMNESVSRVKEMYDLENIKLNTNIAATREAYRKIGNDPNRYRPAADSLIRRIIKGLGLYSVNNTVDVLNLVSIHSGYSISGFDTSKIQGEIYFGIGKQGEPYRGIGRGELNIHNLPVLRDRIGAFGTPTSDSERTMITPETREIVFVFYDFDQHNSCETALDYCENQLIIFCAASDFKKRMLNY